MIALCLLRLVNHVHDPSTDRLDQNLRALALEESEHIEVAVALGRLSPELARDFDYRFDSRAIYLYLTQFLAYCLDRVRVLGSVELIQELADVLSSAAKLRQVLDEASNLSFKLEGPTQPEHLVQIIHAITNGRVGFALLDLERANLITDIGDQVANVHRVENRQEEVHVQPQSRFGFRLTQPARLLEQHDAKFVEPRIAQRQSVFGFIHPEPARPARACGEEDVVVNDLLPRQASLLQRLQVLHEVSKR